MMRALKLTAGLLVCMAAHAQNSAPTGSTVIYKYVDESGRVTYANSPIKGGVRVELDPITVIPSTPSGSLGQAHSPAVAPPAALPVPVAPLPREAQGPSPPAVAVPVARVVASGFRAPNEKIAVKSAPRETSVEADDTPRPLPTRSPALVKATSSAPVHASTPTWPAAETPTAVPTEDRPAASTPAPVAAEPDVQPAVATQANRPMVMTASLSPEAALRISEQRRAETRKRLLEGEMQSEEQLLSHARLALIEEQRLTPGIRALRASFISTGGAGVQPPTKEQRETIERHFERVRNLQDQVAMHETHLKDLRTQLAELK